MKMHLVCLVLAVATPATEGVAVAQDLRPLLLSRQMQQQNEMSQQISLVPDGEDENEANSSLIALQAPPIELSPDGFPKLPEVSKMLNIAQQTLKGLTQQAASLEAEVETSQRDRAKKMSAQKAAFEHKLQAQELANRALIAQNKEIAKQIGVLQHGNSDIGKQAKQLEVANTVMREELHALESRLGVAQDFVGQTLASTDDSRAKELFVLAPTTSAPRAQTQLPETGDAGRLLAAPALPKSQLAVSKGVASLTKNAKSADTETDTTEDQDSDETTDDEVDEEEESEAPSLIALSIKRQAAKPGAPRGETKARDLIKVLQKGMASLSEQERASEAQLRALFMSGFKAGKQRHMSLLSKQKNLNSTRSSLVALQGKLRAAEAHLQATKKQLSAGLHDMGVFLQKLAHLALAPSAEAPRLIKALPSKVVTVAALVASSATPSDPSAVSATPTNEDLSAP